MNKKTIKILVVFAIVIIGVASIIVFTARTKQNKIAPDVNYDGKTSGDCGCGCGGSGGCGDKETTTTSSYTGCSGCGK